ncbi:MAG: PhoPQ-activated protein PqaA family protein, partial [Bacteroidota bacterium]
MNKNKFQILFLLLLALSLSNCTIEDTDNEPEVVITPETALVSYLENGDTTYHWSVKSIFTLAGVNAYDILLTSQNWRGYEWQHQLTVFVPISIKYDGALLWITAGKNIRGEPDWKEQSDMENLMFALTAWQNSAVVAILRQTPNQPLYNNLTEDDLISYTLQQFLLDEDYTWPLLFPMTKGAIRAMDAIQEFATNELQQQINRFVVSGGSKRGWTTWLTGAHDSRVLAIAPAVIDMLNMPVSLDYQLEAWGDYSDQIRSYVDLGIAQHIQNQEGGAISTMIDPYSYREKLTMPKLIILGTNDQFWPVDALKNYIDEIPGENFIHNVPNAGHNLDNGTLQAVDALNGFFANTLQNKSYPGCSWNITESDNKLSIVVQGTAEEIENALLWSATSEDRDFRDAQWSSG